MLNRSTTTTREQRQDDDDKNSSMDNNDNYNATTSRERDQEIRTLQRELKRLTSIIDTHHQRQEPKKPTPVSQHNPPQQTVPWLEDDDIANNPSTGMHPHQYHHHHQPTMVQQHEAVRNRWALRHRVATLTEERRVRSVQREAEESCRVATATFSFKELVATPECPRCGEEVLAPQQQQPQGHGNMEWPFGRYFCCGGTVCRQCFSQQPPQPGCCPLCYGALPTTDPEWTACVRQHAQEGHAWAQEELAVRLLQHHPSSSSPPHTTTSNTGTPPPLMDPSFSSSSPHREAFYWRNLAAASGHALAQTNLGLQYYHGDPEVGIFPNTTTAKEYFWVAAAQGCATAQHCLGELCSKQPQSQSYSGDDDDDEDGDNEDHAVQAVRWWTLAAAQGWAPSQMVLAHCWANGHGDLTTSSSRGNHENYKYETALYWMRQAAAAGLAEAQYWTARYLMASASAAEPHVGQQRSTTGDDDWPTGACRDVVPQALYWARRAASVSAATSSVMGGSSSSNPPVPPRNPRHTQYLLQLEHNMQTHCAYCGATGRPLVVCGHCGSAAYCGRDCQKEHWRMGHKVDCSFFSSTACTDSPAAAASLTK